jgi:uncharacterized GH25 family protein
MTRFAIVAVLFVAVPLSAHDLRVMGGKTLGKPGDEATVYVTFAHTDPVDEVVEANQLENYLLVSPTGSRRPLDKRQGAGLHDATIKPDERGVHQVVANTTVDLQTKIKGDDGRHRHMNGSKADVKKKNPDATIVSAVKSQQFAKTLIVVGKPDRGPEPSGLPFDIVPLDKPSEWKAGAKLRFQVLFNDRPLPNATLTAAPIGFKKPKKAGANHDDENWTQSKKTDKKGIVEIPVDEPGRWVFQVERVVDAVPVNREQYDKENYVTSLTMEIAE